jgi:LPS export ABC transporter permease LptG
MLKGQAPVGVVLRFFYFQTPQFVFWVLPMAVLVATLVTMAVMTKNSELIIMRACGVSLYRTTAPLLVLALGASAVLFALQERVLPRANREADRLNRIIRGFEPQMSPFNQRWIIGRNGSIFNYDTFDSTASRFLHLRTYEVAPDSWRLGAMTYAADATLVRRSADDPTVSLWAGHQGWVRRFSAGSPKAGTHLLEYEPFTERQLTLESPEYFSSRPRDTDQMTYDQMLTFNELRSYIDQLRASGANVVPYVVALQRKIAFPLVTVLMTVLAVPFGVSGGRRGALYGVGIGLVLALGYFVTMSVFGAFGAGGILPPALAAWAANLLFGAAAVYMILTVRT